MPRVRTSRTIPVAAAVLALAAPLAPVASAGTAGASCAAGAVTFGPATDAAAFAWTLGTTLLQNGTARVQVQPDAGGTFTTLVTATVRTAGARTTAGSIATPVVLSAGSWNWRVQVTEWDGTTFLCSGSAISVTRLPAPAIVLTGIGVTPDGWRLLAGGQSALVYPGAGDGLPGSTSQVRVKYATGTWSAWQAAPMELPTSDIIAIRAYRRTSDAMSGTMTTTAIQKDIVAPAPPEPVTDEIEVGPEDVDIAFVPSVDAQSGIGSHQSRLVEDDGPTGDWQYLSGTTVRVGYGTAGGTLMLRACDRVGNCSAPSEVTLLPMHLPEPTPDTDDAPPPPTSGSRRGSGTSNRSSVPPRIGALVPGSPRGGAGRVSVDLSRPAEVTFSFAGAPIATAWLGAGRTVVRLPAQASARRGRLTALPVAGPVSGEPVTATVSLPGGQRKRESARITTRLRGDARSILYDMDAAVREIVDPQDGGTGMGIARGALRQEPSTSGLFSADDEASLVGKVTEEDLRGLMADEIADVLVAAIDEAPGHIVGFDELTAYEADPRSPVVKGGRIPPADPSSPGAQFAQALIALDTPSPHGGTWASRVHVYVAPAVTSAMAAGRGPDRNLGRDGKAHFRTYRTVMTGLARAGAVWIEAYHGRTSPLTPFTAAEWRTAPAAVTAEYRRAGGDPTRLHLLMTGTDAYPVGSLPPGCTTPQRCQWVLAEATAAGRAMVANGVGAYRLGAQARPWLAEWQARAA